MQANANQTMLWSLIQQAPVGPDSPAFADWLRTTLSRDDLAGLPDDDVAALGLFALRRRYPPRSPLFTRGEAPDALYIVERGVVDLLHDHGSGTVFLQAVRRGIAAGELPALLGVEHVYSAITRTETTVLELRRDTIDALVQLEPAIGFRLLRLVSLRLAGLERRVLELGRRSAFEQLVALLLRESDEQRSTTVRLTHDRIAGELGLSRQTVSRILGELAQHGLVERRRGHVTIAAPDRLRQIAVTQRRD